MTAKIYLPSVICAECGSLLPLTSTETQDGKAWFYAHYPSKALRCPLQRKRIIAEAAEMEVAQ